MKSIFSDTSSVLSLHYILFFTRHSLHSVYTTVHKVFAASGRTLSSKSKRELCAGALVEAPHAKWLASPPLAAVVGQKNPLFHQKADSVTIDQLAPYSPIRMNYMRLNPVSSIYEKFPRLNSRNSIYVSSRAALYEILPKTTNYTITAAAIEPYKKSSYYPGTRILKLEGYNYWAQAGWIKHKSTILPPLGQDFAQSLNDYFQ